MGAIFENVRIPRYAMAGNPLVVCLSNTGNAVGEALVEVSAQGATLWQETYTVGGGASVYADLREVVEPLVSPPELAPAGEGSGALGVAHTPQRILLSVTWDDGVASSDVLLLYGAFPPGDLLRHGCTASQLITERLVGAQLPATPRPSPFFTVRNRSYLVELHEDEASPLCFLAESPTDVAVYNSLGSPVDAFRATASSFPALFYFNPAPLMGGGRRYFKLVFSGNEAEAVHVCITPNPRARHLRALEYLGSLGCYERLTLCGEKSVTTQFDESEEEAQLNELLPALQVYRRRGVRRSGKRRIRLTTSAAGGRLLAIKDMVGSERIRLDGEEVVCTSAEVETYADADRTAPREVELAFLSIEG
jgi:hypothetical protein